MAEEGLREKGVSRFAPPTQPVEINPLTLPAGTTLFRVHRQQFAGNSFNPALSGNARFSPIFSASGAVIPTLYAGESSRVALCEVIFHDLDLSSPCLSYPVALLAGFRHTQLVTTAALQLASLDLPSLVKMRAGKKLIHSDASDYGITRRWAEAIHHQHPHIQGLAWPSRQHQGNAWLLFGDRIEPQRVVRERKTLRITERPVVEELLALAERMGIVLDE